MSDTDLERGLGRRLIRNLTAQSLTQVLVTLMGLVTTYVHHDHARGVVELHALHDSVLQPQQGTPYPCFLHAALRSRFQVLDSPKSIARAACTHFTAASQHPRMRQEIPKKGPNSRNRS